MGGFENKEMKYLDRAEKWQEKWDNKLCSRRYMFTLPHTSNEILNLTRFMLLLNLIFK